MEHLTAALAAYLKEYPELEDRRLGIDRLTGELYAFALLTDGEEQSERYLTGEKRMRVCWLAAELPYGADNTRNEENLAWFERFGRWLGLRAARHDLPRLTDGTECVGIASGTTGTILEMTGDGRALYRIRLEVSYTEELI